MHRIIALVGVVGFVVPALAQTVPVLPKIWQGNLSATHAGATSPSKHSPDHPDNGGPKGDAAFSRTDEVRTLTVVRQDGRHLAGTWSSSRHVANWVGTLSMDGRQLQVATDTNSLFNLTIDGDRMYGCGGASSPTKRSAICLDFKVAR